MSKPFSETKPGWQLPAEEPYLPGQTPRPGDDSIVHKIARRPPVPTDPDRWAENEPWMAGVRLYDAGYYWEAHEVWEKVWMNARPNSLERILVQAVIQLSNSALKQRMGRHKAASRLADIASALISESLQQRPASLMGLDTARLSAEAECFRLGLQSGIATTPPRLNVLCP